VVTSVRFRMTSEAGELVAAVVHGIDQHLHNNNKSKRSSSLSFQQHLFSNLSPEIRALFSDFLNI
jgi:hypothetical protein